MKVQVDDARSAGTNLHSKTAKILGLSRDQAKVFKYLGLGCRSAPPTQRGDVGMKSSKTGQLIRHRHVYVVTCVEQGAPPEGIGLYAFGNQLDRPILGYVLPPHSNPCHTGHSHRSARSRVLTGINLMHHASKLSKLLSTSTITRQFNAGVDNLQLSASLK